MEWWLSDELMLSTISTVKRNCNMVLKSNIFKAGWWSFTKNIRGCENIHFWVWPRGRYYEGRSDPGQSLGRTDYLSSVCEPFPRQFVLYFVDLKWWTRQAIRSLSFQHFKYSNGKILSNLVYDIVIHFSLNTDFFVKIPFIIYDW